MRAKAAAFCAAVISFQANTLAVVNTIVDVEPFSPLLIVNSELDCFPLTIIKGG